MTADNAPAAHSDAADQVAEAFWSVQLLTPTGVVNYEVANNDAVFGAREVSTDTQAPPAPTAPVAPAATLDLDTAPLGDEPTSADADAAGSDDALETDDADSTTGDEDAADSASGDEVDLDS